VSRHPALATATILVAVDLCPESRPALQYTAALARRLSAKLDIVSNIDLSMPSLSQLVPDASVLAALRRANQHSVQDLTRDLSGVQVEVLTQETFSEAEAILNAAEHTGADLIVMRSSCASRLRRLFFGSTLEQVLTQAHCPVLIIGPRARDLTASAGCFHNILCASKRIHPASHTLNYAMELAEREGAHLCLCHVEPPADAYGTPDDQSLLERLSRLIPPQLRDANHPECVVEHGAVTASILNRARRVHADLIVLGSRGESFWPTGIAEGTIPPLLSQAECPVLTVCH
jgi:nucleotide-binding universal stress UspA family protein